MMSLVLTSAPALEPITLAEAKSFLRVDTSADDLLVNALIATSRLQIEQSLSLALIHQSWTYRLDAWPTSRIVPFMLAPVAQLTSARIFGPDDTPTTIPLTAFQLDAAASPPRLCLKSSISSPLRPMSAIEINFIAGFGATAASVPAPIRHALLLLIAHWYEHRDNSATEPSNPKVPDAIAALLAPWRAPRLT